MLKSACKTKDGLKTKGVYLYSYSDSFFGDSLSVKSDSNNQQMYWGIPANQVDIAMLLLPGRIHELHSGHGPGQKQLSGFAEASTRQNRAECCTVTSDRLF